MYGDLDATHGMIIQPEKLKTELMQHQKTAVYAMLELEKTLQIKFRMRYYDNDEKNLRLDTKIGILGDKVGSGKTLVIISLLMNSSATIKSATRYEGNVYVSVSCVDEDNNYIDVSTNLLILPDILVNQWLNDFARFAPHLKINIFEPVKDIKKITDIKDIAGSDVLIVPCKHIGEFNKVFSNINWKRAIIDEADTCNIKIENCFNINANFYWLVTGTPMKIVYSRIKYIKSIFGTNQTWLPEFITIRNNDKFINESIKLPKPNRHIVNCITPPEIKHIKEYIPKSIINMINAGNTKTAIKLLGCNIDTHANIFKALTGKYNMVIQRKHEEIKKLEHQLKGPKKISYENMNKIQEQIASANKIIGRARTRIDAINKKINDIKHDICPCCMGNFKKTTILSCCNSIYCFECITFMLQKNNKCPSCKKNVSKNMINIVGVNKHKESTENKKHKIDEMLHIVSSNKNGKFLIFANYTQTLNKIMEKLGKDNYKYRLLGGTPGAVTATLDTFKTDNSMNILLLNASNFGAGLNIQNATDIIIYHRFDKELEEQVIGRAQRYGREGILNIYYLIHDNETHDFMTSSKFDFNDVVLNNEINKELDSDYCDSDKDSDENSDNDTSDSDDSETYDYSNSDNSSGDEISDTGDTI